MGPPGSLHITTLHGSLILFGGSDPPYFAHWLQVRHDNTMPPHRTMVPRLQKQTVAIIPFYTMLLIIANNYIFSNCVCVLSVFYLVFMLLV